VPARSTKAKKATTEDRGEAVRASRMTRQKRAVASLLAETDEFTSAQELHARLRESGEKVGLATVYSQLRALADAGDIDSVRGDTGETLYRRCDLVSHHHHLVCRRCGHAVELDAPEVETWARRVGGRYGFRHLDHVLEITGICDRCTEEQR
jgi:Fur family transcriptional regulator, ferric uptake regulator